MCNFITCIIRKDFKSEITCSIIFDIVGQMTNCTMVHLLNSYLKYDQGLSSSRFQYDVKNARYRKIIFFCVDLYRTSNLQGCNKL